MELIDRLIKLPILSSALGTLVRHGIGWLGAGLLALGLKNDLVLPFVSSFEQVLLALVPIGLSFLFSRIEKKSR